MRVSIILLKRMDILTCRWELSYAVGKYSISVYYFVGRYSQLKNRRIVRQLTVHVPTVSFRFFLTTFSLKQSETD